MLRDAREHVGLKLGTLARHTARRLGAEDEERAPESIRVRLHQVDRGPQYTLPRHVHEAALAVILRHLDAWPADERGRALADALREDGRLAPLRARAARLAGGVRVAEDTVARAEAALADARAELVDARRLAGEATAELARRERKSATER